MISTFFFLSNRCRIQQILWRINPSPSAEQDQRNATKLGRARRWTQSPTLPVNTKRSSQTKQTLTTLNCIETLGAVAFVLCELETDLLSLGIDVHDLAPPTPEVVHVRCTRRDRLKMGSWRLGRWCLVRGIRVWVFFLYCRLARPLSSSCGPMIGSGSRDSSLIRVLISVCRYASTSSQDSNHARSVVSVWYHDVDCPSQRREGADRTLVSPSEDFCGGRRGADLETESRSMVSPASARTARGDRNENVGHRLSETPPEQSLLQQTGRLNIHVNIVGLLCDLERVSCSFFEYPMLLFIESDLWFDVNVFVPRSESLLSHSVMWILLKI